MSDNSITLVGNLTDGPELRFTPNGIAVVNIGLAVTPRLREGDGWKDGETSVFRVNVWRGLAEHVADSLSKGDRVVVVGRLRTRSWETPEGDKRSVVEVEADELGPSLKFTTAKPQQTRDLATATQTKRPTREGGQAEPTTSAYRRVATRRPATTSPWPYTSSVPRVRAGGGGAVAPTGPGPT